MAKNKEEQVESEDRKGGKLPLIIGAVVLLVAGVVLGGKFLGGGSVEEASTTTTTTTTPPGTVTTLDSITLNLADGRFLKLGLGFEVRHDAEYPAEDEMADDTKGFARELDAVIDIVSAHTYTDLIAPGGKEMVKAEILDRVQKISDDSIEAVLFHEFVMQ